MTEKNKIKMNKEGSKKGIVFNKNDDIKNVIMSLSNVLYTKPIDEFFG